MVVRCRVKRKKKNVSERARIRQSVEEWRSLLGGTRRM